MELLTIGDLARRFGMQTSALRFYERIGLMPPPERKHGQRRYDSRAVTRIAAIQAARRAGFNLSEARMLLDEFPAAVPAHERWRALAIQKNQELDKLMMQIQEKKHYLAAGIACECESFEACPLLIESAIPIR